MTFINNIPEQEHTPARQPGSAPRDTDPLHELLQDHISRCDTCRNAINTDKPRGFGQKSGHCAEYFNLIGMYARGEFHRDDNRRNN